MKLTPVHLTHVLLCHLCNCVHFLTSLESQAKLCLDICHHIELHRLPTAHPVSQSPDMWSRTWKLVRSNESIASVEEYVCPDGKEIEIWIVCKLCRKGTISMSTWNRKLNLPLEEKMQLRKDYLKLKPMWRLEDGNRKGSEMALYATDRELESQRLELHQANQCADQPQRENINLCGELEMRNRLFEESRARTQEIEELRRTCCEEPNRADN